MPRHLSCEVENFVDAHLCPLRVMLRFVLVTRNRGIVLVDYHLCTLGSTILLTVAPLCFYFSPCLLLPSPPPPPVFSLAIRLRRRPAPLNAMFSYYYYFLQPKTQVRVGAKLTILGCSVGDSGDLCGTPSVRVRPSFHRSNARFSFRVADVHSPRSSVTKTV